MGIVKKEDIKGYRVNQEIVCEDCISAEELDDVFESDILSRMMPLFLSSATDVKRSSKSVRTARRGGSNNASAPFFVLHLMILTM